MWGLGHCKVTIILRYLKLNLRDIGDSFKMRNNTVYTRANYITLVELDRGLTGSGRRKLREREKGRVV